MSKTTHQSNARARLSLAQLNGWHEVEA